MPDPAGINCGEERKGEMSGCYTDAVTITGREGG